MLDLNKILDAVFDEGTPHKRDYKMYPECRPWPILLYEMAKVEDKYLKRLPNYIQTSLLNALKPLPSDQNLWQRFNSHMGFEITEEYIWFRMFQYQKKHGSILSDAEIEDMIGYVGNIPELNEKEKDFGKENTNPS